MDLQSYFMEELKNGANADDLARIMTDALNTAIRQRAEEAEAKNRKLKRQASLTEEITQYITEFYPDAKEAGKYAKFLVERLDNTFSAKEPMPNYPPCKMPTEEEKAQIEGLIKSAEDIIKLFAESLS